MVSRSRQNPILKVIYTILYPLLIINHLYSGRLVRVALVAVVCDKPAAHKMGGFASHSHTNFCTECWISTEDKGKPSGFQRNGKSFLISFACTIEITIHQGSCQGPINNSVHSVTSIVHSLTSACLFAHDGEAVLRQRVSLIEKLEAEKILEAERKAANKKALQDAKKLGKEALAAERARIAAANLEASEAKKREKLQQQAERKAEKARLAAEKKVCDFPCLWSNPTNTI